MNFLPPEPEVDLYSEGFEGIDILERKRASEALSALLNRIDDPFVVALDGRWGSGKSYFLKRWVGAHNNENGASATTVYFDAFAHDYVSDPLPALVSSLTRRLPLSDATQIEKLKEAAFKLAKPITRLGLAVATFGATEALGDIADVAVETASSEAIDGLNEYWEKEKSRQTAMAEFRLSIEALASAPAENGVGSRVVIVIDELDRCRPDYALEVLEVIKHFFSVPRVHFVLGVNLKALENSVRVRYGDRIDATSYLKKFIQVTLKLPADTGDEHNPRPTIVTYLRHLIKEMGVPDHIGVRLISQVNLVSKSNEISLRDAGKIVSAICLADDSVLNKSSWMTGWIDVMNDLIISSVVRPDLYPKFLSADVGDAELRDYFGANDTVLSDKLDGEYNQDFNHEIYVRYHSWLYLSHDGRLDGDNPDFNRSIGRQFDDFGTVRSAKTLPQRIHRMWLDQFEFYN